MSSRKSGPIKALNPLESCISHSWIPDARIAVSKDKRVFAYVERIKVVEYVAVVVFVKSEIETSVTVVGTWRV